MSSTVERLGSPGAALLLQSVASPDPHPLRCIPWLGSAEFSLALSAANPDRLPPRKTSLQVVKASNCDLLSVQEISNSRNKDPVGLLNECID